MTPSNSSGRSLASLVSEAASQITRFDPAEAFAASQAGALIIDIRSEQNRRRDGVVPHSIHIPRTVLEWRIAMDSPWRNPHIGGRDEQLILMCDHGFATVLAASTLVQLGFHRAGDVNGGFAAWKASGQATAAYRHQPAEPDALPGTGPPR